jgi:hypothetical protein
MNNRSVMPGFFERNLSRKALHNSLYVRLGLIEIAKRFLRTLNAFAHGIDIKQA